MVHQVSASPARQQSEISHAREREGGREGERGREEGRERKKDERGGFEEDKQVTHGIHSFSLKQISLVKMPDLKNV